MSALPADWFGLLVVVFLLGMRHGMDADHLATIDGFTREYSTLMPTNTSVAALLPWNMVMAWVCAVTFRVRNRWWIRRVRSRRLSTAFAASHHYIPPIGSYSSDLQQEWSNDSPAC